MTDEPSGLERIGVVAHYNLLDRLGEGVLGEVYRARDTKYGRTVALKFVPAGLVDEKRYQRLIDDARAASALSHPNVATLFDVGHHEGRLYLAYEFVQGTTLRQQMANGAMNPRHALDLAMQVAEAAAEAQKHGIVHKDLRPDTILETAKGSAKVLDFGMSVWTRGGQTRALAAAAPGSLGPEAQSIVPYMSPEQALGGRVDRRTDVFSLAVIVYEMVTGVNPFADPSVATTLVNIARKAVPPPTSINPDLPKMFDVVLGRALNKDLDHRTDSAMRLATELRRCRGLLDAGSPDAAVAPSRPAPPRADVIHIEEERGGHALWWILAMLGVGAVAVIYYLMR
jgi:serine/threonine protein kinase